MLAGNIHLTLAFIGNVAAGRVPELCALAASIVAPSFDLTIDAAEYWRHNRILWAGPKDCPDALRLLVNGLEDALRKAGFHTEERAYAPHITLLRDARRAPSTLTLPGIRWRLTEFALMQSLRRNNATAYEPIQLWPLRPA